MCYTLQILRSAVTEKCLLLRFSQTKGMPVNQRPLDHCMRGLVDRMLSSLFTKDRRQSKTLETIDERGSKIARNSVFDCLWSPVDSKTPASWRHPNSKSSRFFCLNIYEGLDGESFIHCSLKI